MRSVWLGWVIALAAAGCGPTILEKKVVEAPPPEALRPGPSPEETAGDVPTLVDLDPAFTLVPDGFEAPPPPDDPRPLALLEAERPAEPAPTAATPGGEGGADGVAAPSEGEDDGEVDGEGDEGVDDSSE